MKKVFISIPMNGRDYDDILSDINRVRDICRERIDDEVTFIESLLQNFSGNPVKALAKSIDYLADADIAFFCKGWDNARGCNIEHLICEKYNITILEE